VFDEYVDGGISEVTFERTGFKRMITDIKESKIDTVVCKDCPVWVVIMKPTQADC